MNDYKTGWAYVCNKVFSVYWRMVSGFKGVDVLVFCEIDGVK